MSDTPKLDALLNGMGSTMSPSLPVAQTSPAPDQTSQLIENANQTANAVINATPLLDQLLDKSRPKTPSQQMMATAPIPPSSSFTDGSPESAGVIKSLDNFNHSMGQALYQHFTDVPAQLFGGMWDSERNQADLTSNLIFKALTPVQKMLGVSDEEASKVQGEMTPSNSIPTVPPADEIVGKMGRPLAQFLASYALAGKIGQGIEATSATGKILLETSQVFGAAFAGFKGNEGRLADLLPHLGITEPIKNYLGTDKNDGELTARFKTAIEQAGLTAGVAGLTKFLGWSVNAYRARNALDTAAAKTKELIQGGKGATARMAPNAPVFNEDIAFRDTANWRDFHDQLVAARQLSMTEEQLVSGEAKATTNTAQTEAANKATIIQTDAYIQKFLPAIQLAEKRVAAGDKSAYADVVEAFNEYAKVHGAAQDLAREPSQALKFRSQNPTVIMANKLMDIFNSSDGRTKEEMGKVMADIMTKNAANIDEFGKQVMPRLSIGKTIENALHEGYINSLLSNPFSTWTKDIGSRIVLNGLLNPTERLGGAMWASIRRSLWERGENGTDRVSYSEVAMQLKSYVDSCGDLLSYLWKSGINYGKDVLTGEPDATLGWLDKLKEMREQNAVMFDAPRNMKSISAEAFGLQRKTLLGRAIDTAGNIIRSPAEALSIKNDFNQSALYRMEMVTRANRLATFKGLEGDAYEQMVQNTIRAGATDINWADQSMAKSTLLNMGIDFGSDKGFSDVASLISKARKQAMIDSLSSELGTFGKGVSRLLDKVPYVGWLLVPFKKITGNIFNATIQRSPFALVTRDFWNAIAAGGAEQDMAMGRIAVGSTISTVAAHMAMTGQITGKSVFNPEHELLMREIGYLPNALKIGDTYVDLTPYEPLTSLITVPATLYQMHEEASMPLTESQKQSFADIMILSSMGLATVLLDKTYSQNMFHFMEALESKSPRKFETLATQIGSGFTDPALVQFSHNKVYPYVQQIDGLIQKTKTDWNLWDPGTPKRDFMGDPIKRESAFAWLLPYSSVDRTPKGDVIREMIKVGFAPKPPDTIVDGVELNKDQYDQLMVNIQNSKPLEQYQKLINSSQYQRLSDNYLGKPAPTSPTISAEYTKSQALSDLSSSIKTQAELKLKKDDKDLGGQIKALEQQKVITPKRSHMDDLILQSQQNVPTYP